MNSATTGMHTEITDKSSNGTFVNGERLHKGHPLILPSGAEIAIAVARHKGKPKLGGKRSQSRNNVDQFCRRENYLSVSVQERSTFILA